MDDEQYAAARERLELDYIAGALSADEYTRLRRRLHEQATSGSSEPEPSASEEPVRMPPLPRQDSSGIVPEHSDPVTGAPLASWGIRALGWVIDLLAYIGMWITVAFFPLDDGLISVFVVFAPSVYQWLMIGRWGQTLGQMAVGIRVVRSEDVVAVSYLRSLGRAASVWALGLVLLPLLLAYLWPLWDRRNQTIYDKMASTIVIDAKHLVTRP